VDPGGTPRKKAGLTDTLTKCLTGWLTGGKFSEKLPAHALVACHIPAQNDPAGTLTRELGPAPSRRAMRSSQSCNGVAGVGCYERYGSKLVNLSGSV
jgi:hypothetical protein